VPDDLELMALYRVGYVDEDAVRPPIDWSSRHRKRRSDFVFRNTCATPEPDGAAPDPVDAGVDDVRDPAASQSEQIVGR
jgi:hypothetical protein